MKAPSTSTTELLSLIFTAWGDQLKPTGLLVITDTILNRVTLNWKKGKRTHVFIDEFHVVFENEQSGIFFNSAWRQFRKRNGYPTAITQNVEYLLDSVQASTMLSNSEFVVMLNQAYSDRSKLSKLLNISDEQMSYVTNADAGCGLIKYGSALVPFINRFPRDTKLYQLMTTKPGEGVFGGGTLQSKTGGQFEYEKQISDDRGGIFCRPFPFLRRYALSAVCGRKQSAEAFDKIAALVQDETPPADEPQESEPPQPEQTAFEKYAVVYEQNSDFVGWISIEGTNIDYPVMQTIDNPNYYLKHSFEKQYSDYGVPYVQENCDLGFSDNCVIYGHHMNNGSMFADLCKYADEDFYREHKTIRFDTLSGFGEYEVVAAFKTAAYSEQGFKYYHFVNAEGERISTPISPKCKELALYDTGVSAEYGDRLITLSTCEYSRQNGRMVVVAKQVIPPSLEVDGDEA